MSNAQVQSNPDVTANKARSTTTCTVGCKLPHGLHLELFNDQGAVAEHHVIKGMNDSRIVGGYGITEGVPMAFMEEWFKRNFAHPAVVGERIFMQNDKRSAESCAKERRGVRTGLEAIDPLRDGKKHGLEMDKDSEAEYRRQVQDNPDRNRQRVE